MPTIDNRIRSRAHQIWEEEGCPEGRADKHWEKARILVAIEDDRTSLVPAAETTAGEPVEEASLQQNLGEFPAGRTDQRERANAVTREWASAKPAVPGRAQQALIARPHLMRWSVAKFPD
jgi:hypothetical protein